MSDRAASNAGVVRDTAAWGSSWMYCRRCGWSPTSCEHLWAEDEDDQGREIARTPWAEERNERRFGDAR